MTALLEVCCANLQSVIAAAEAGAPRIELCSALPVGGVTPSLGLLRAVRSRFPRLTIHVLVRPREGGFVYSPAEAALMEADIRAAVSEGADGIVCGALCPDGTIDVPLTARLVAAAGGRPFTFHRAFDFVPSPADALETLIDLGCTRVLTSGGAPTALDGAETLRALIAQAAGRITVLPGGGINADNAASLLHLTGAAELHASCSAPSADNAHATSLPPIPGLGAGYSCTSAKAVRSLLRAIGGTTPQA